MTEATREDIKSRIEAGEAGKSARQAAPLSERIGENAIEAKDGFTRFASEHPVATIAGGLALGVLVSTLFRGSPTRKAAKKAGTKGSAIAGIAAKLAFDYAQAALSAANDARRTGADQLESLAETTGETARGLRRSASRRASDAGDSALHAARDARKAISRALHRAR